MSYIKIIPTEREIMTIKEMVNKNESYRTMAKELSMCDKTVIRIINDYNIDMSNYNVRVAHGKKRFKQLDDNTVNGIISLLEQGLSVREIMLNFKFVSRPTLDRILKERGIDLKDYKRVNKRKFIMTNKQIEEAKRDLANNVKIKDIASKNNVSRNVCSYYLKSIGVINENVIVDYKVKNFIIKLHSNYITINNIKLITNINKDTIKDIIDDLGLDISETVKYKKNISNNCNENKILLNYLNEFNAFSNIQPVNFSDAMYVIENISKRPFIDLIIEMKCDYDEMKHFLNLIGYNYIFFYENMKTYDYYNELHNDMSNAVHSNVAIAKKYGQGYMTISNWRKQIFGNINSYYRANFSRSNFEIDFELMLNEINMAYIKEYRIKGLKYDYYLGHNILVELNGSYWHKNNEDSDFDKYDNVVEYDLIKIDENEFYNNKLKFRKQIIDLYILNIINDFNIFI